jgi:hypothetical protein
LIGDHVAARFDVADGPTLHDRAPAVDQVCTGTDFTMLGACASRGHHATGDGAVIKALDVLAIVAARVAITVLAMRFPDTGFRRDVPVWVYLRDLAAAPCIFA